MIIIINSSAVNLNVIRSRGGYDVDINHLSFFDFSSIASSFSFIDYWLWNYCLCRSSSAVRFTLAAASLSTEDFRMSIMTFVSSIDYSIHRVVWVECPLHFSKAPPSFFFASLRFLLQNSTNYRDNNSKVSNLWTVNEKLLAILKCRRTRTDKYCRCR